MSENHPGQGHRERLRLKFLNHGLEKFTDEDILELLLTLATPRQDCKQRARQLLKHFGNLAYVLEANAKELAAIEGIGPKNILGIKLIPAVAKRYLENKIQTQAALLDYTQIADYLRFTMSSLNQEVFRVLCLDDQRRICGTADLFHGTIDKAVVFPREVVGEALQKGASAVICAHNHPSGRVQPSLSDQALTRKLYLACKAVDLELVDHVIVGREDVYSFAQSGKLALFQREFIELG